MNYSEWHATVPEEIRNDPLWNQEAYRLALFAADLSWRDATKLFRDARTTKLAAQLLDAVGSVGANIAEGYSRGHCKDRARFYEYALGSARESRTWYFGGRHVLGEAVARHRISMQTQVIRLLLSMIPSTRGYSLHEGDMSVEIGMPDDIQGTQPSTTSTLPTNDVPMPSLSFTEPAIRNTSTP